MENKIQKLFNTNPVFFQEVIAFIDENYDFTPTAFKNGNQYNEAGQNNGSCKVFAFAQLQDLSKEETLSLFCEYYQDVLKTPEAVDHQNIRNFMQFSWEGISFEGEPLLLKSEV
ncbi:HopJ type III effector protein [Flavobacterium sp. H122]|uniref:HopJ type III effector protein n=1 Tax=Flavobacterium sp. H122 TaxID=2529860 RepID=UPI0010AB4C85|nr:HopJ type III effector protein [Flavobacterium sp. H122]